MIKSFSKIDAVHEIIVSVPLYEANMVGRVFLYVFEGNFIEVTYRKKEFRHLTGVGTNLSPNDFYKIALSGKLTPNQIFFDNRHPAKLCQRKMRHIQNLSAVINSDILILEMIGTKSKSYKFGLTELEFTLCLDKDLDSTGTPKSDYYIVQSLRDEDSFSKSGHQYECNFIFSKKNDQVLYDTLNYSDKKQKVDDLPQIIKEKLSETLKDGAI